MLETLINTSEIVRKTSHEHVVWSVYLLIAEKLAEYGAGELGESVQGEKEDINAAEGEGSSGDLSAIASDVLCTLARFQSHY